MQYGLRRTLHLRTGTTLLSDRQARHGHTEWDSDKACPLVDLGPPPKLHLAALARLLRLPARLEHLHGQASVVHHSLHSGLRRHQVAGAPSVAVEGLAPHQPLDRSRRLLAAAQIQRQAQASVRHLH